MSSRQPEPPPIRATTPVPPSDGPSPWELVKSACPPGQFPVAAHIGISGNVVDSRGDAGELAARAAYASQIAQLVGGELGLGRFLALQATDARDQIIIGADPNGETVVVRGRRGAAATALCERLRL